MPRGPKPVPTAVKRARGNPGHRALPKEEPAPPTADVESDMPEGLSDDARVCWRQAHRMLSNAGVLTVMDVPMLMLYCESWSRYKKAQTEMRKPGQGMVIRNAMGKTRNPWLAILDKAHEQMLKIQLEYGMSPAARTRVRIVATPPAPVKGGAVVPRPGNVFELIKSTAKAR